MIFAAYQLVLIDKTSLNFSRFTTQRPNSDGNNQEKESGGQYRQNGILEK